MNQHTSLRASAWVLCALVLTWPVAAAAQVMKSSNYGITDINFNTAITISIDQDSTPPVLVSGPNVTELEPRKATIEWLTDKKSSSTVKYGITTAYGLDNGSATQAVKHKVSLFGLDPETTYHYKVVSTDALNATGESADKTFTTPADAGINTIKVSDVGYDRALIAWKTGNATVSRLEYGTDVSYGQTKATSSGAFSADHTVQLTGLAPGTDYHFRIVAENDKAAVLRSSDQTFTTIAEPKFISVNAVPISVNEVALEWQTNTLTTSLVKYRAVSGPNKEAQTDGTAELASRHKIRIKNLVGDTPYTFNITATDQQGKQVLSGERTFQTPIDKVAPEISNLKVSVARSGDELVLTTSWQTNEPAKGEIVYGPKTRVDQTVDLPGPPAYTIDHVLVATGLRAATPYGLTAFTTDLAGNRGKADISFVSPKLSKTIVQLLIDSFLNRFGWLANVFGQ